MVEVVDAEFAEDLAHVGLVVPRAEGIHLGLRGGNAGMVAGSESLFVARRHLGELVAYG